MTKIRYLFTGLTVALASLLTAGSAYAENFQSWVSSTGGGTACTRAAPCSTFTAAMNATGAGGVISVVDGGNYGGIDITKSLTIRADGADAGATFLPVISGGEVIVEAGASDVVTIEGLHFSGTGGITFESGAHLHVIRCFFVSGAAAGNTGIGFIPTGFSKLSVTDTVINNIGLGTGGGIVVNPQPSGVAQVALERVTVNGNAFGIAADGTNSTRGINMTIADSMIANNTNDGIIATTPSGGAPIGVMVKNTKSVNNAFGIRSLGNNVTVRVDGSTIVGNSTGLSFAGGGALLSFGNNNVEANGINGSFSAQVALK